MAHGPVLVTGGSGFVGRALLTAFAEADVEVHATYWPDQPTTPLANTFWHRINLLEPAPIEALMRELVPERLVHLAWYVEHGRFWSAPENLDWVAASLHLLRAFAASGGQRVVITGTCAEYDWTVSGPLTESTSPLAPATVYGAAKDGLRRVAAAFARQEGVELAWARLFFMYGPGEAPGRLVPSVINALIAGEPAPTTEGAQVRDFLHIEDVGRALAALLDSSVVGPVNIASGKGIALRELFAVIGQATGREDLIRRGALPTPAGEPPSLVGDVRRLREEVGVEPRIELATGISQTVSWWRERAGSAEAS
jgi:nucleoside-diphosphate-sugar epimerase